MLEWYHKNSASFPFPYILLLILIHKLHAREAYEQLKRNKSQASSFGPQRGQKNIIRRCRPSPPVNDDDDDHDTQCEPTPLPIPRSYHIDRSVGRAPHLSQPPPLHYQRQKVILYFRRWFVFVLDVRSLIVVLEAVECSGSRFPNSKSATTQQPLHIGQDRRS